MHKSSSGVTGSHAWPPEVAIWSSVDRVLTVLQCSHPTLGNSLSPIPVEAFPNGGSLDVDGLFQQEFLRSPGPVNHRCVLQNTSVVDWARRPEELLLKEAIHIQRTPVGERLNRDGGKGVPKCWMATLKHSEDAVNRRPNRNFRRPSVASGDTG